ncbi:hypothetical protein KUCAC02_009941, partial [Chaenocephalus aceratus]
NAVRTLSVSKLSLNSVHGVFRQVRRGLFARVAFHGASSVLVYGKQTQAKFSTDKKSVWKSLGFAVRAAAE